MAQQHAPLSRGVWGILATPFRGSSLEVDTGSLQRLVAHYIRSGVSGVVALGVLGEASRLSAAERRLVLSTIVEAAGSMPVVAGMSALSTAPAVEEATFAAQTGATAVMVLVNGGVPERLTEHLVAIARASKLGIVLQDHPATTGISIAPPALIATVCDSGVVVAVKAEAPPTSPGIATISGAIPVPMFGGLGGVSLLDELLAGSAGAMTGFAVPEALVATVDAWQSKGYAAARDAFMPWAPLILFEGQEKVSLALRKELLRRRGLIEESRVRPPGVDMPQSLHAALEAHLGSVTLPSV